MVFSADSHAGVVSDSFSTKAAKVVASTSAAELGLLVDDDEDGQFVALDVAGSGLRVEGDVSRTVIGANVVVVVVLVARCVVALLVVLGLVVLVVVVLLAAAIGCLTDMITCCLLSDIPLVTMS